MDALNRHLKCGMGVECASVVGRRMGCGRGGGMLGNLNSGFDLSGITMRSVGGSGMVVELGEEQKQSSLPKRRQIGGGGGGTDIWSGVTL